MVAVHIFLLGTMFCGYYYFTIDLYELSFFCKVLHLIV